MKRTNVDIAVIGGGAAGLVAAAGTAAFGARTVLIERNRLGGECTWTGCVPSKALLHIAHQHQKQRAAAALGLYTSTSGLDFRAVMASVRDTRRWIYEHRETPGYLKELGVRPINAEARFRDQHTLEIKRGGRARELTFRTAIIAVGSRPYVPAVPELEQGMYLTTDSLFEINELPQRLAILGGGPTGVEMAQAFSRLGSDVTLISRDDHLLPAMESDGSSLVAASLRNDGVSLHLRSTITLAARSEAGLRLELTGAGEPLRIEVDQLLVATGRVANTAGLDLEAADVGYVPHGIPVDACCRTSVRHIFACGDVTTAPNLTHVAENMARAAAVNALTRLPVRNYERAIIPMVVYTDPEIATVGRTGSDLERDGSAYDAIELPYASIDRAVIDQKSTGFIRIYHRFGEVLGATIVGAQAGELITEYALAMQQRLRLPALSETPHPYPTMMLGARRAADQFYVRLLKRWLVEPFRLGHGYRGRIPAYIGTDAIV